MTDPEISEQEQRAITILARRLQPRLVAGVDAHEIAAQFIRDLRNEGWRPPLRPAPPRDRPATPDTTHRGADLARRALAGEDIP